MYMCEREREEGNDREVKQNLYMYHTNPTITVIKLLRLAFGT